MDAALKYSVDGMSGVEGGARGPVFGRGRGRLSEKFHFYILCLCQERGKKGRVKRGAGEQAYVDVLLFSPQDAKGGVGIERP